MTRVVQSSAHTAGRDSGDGSAVGGQQRALPRDRLTVMCLTLAVAVLLPGVLAAVAGPLAPGTMLGQWHQDMIVVLRDIRFGSGVRFWLGVAGASAMALLLVYPLRKAVPLRFRIGRVASWFRLHIVIGVFAPVSILYHANFGFGGFNANVALFAMLAIAVSGLVGQFVYHPSNAGFHGGVAEIEARGVAVADGLRQIDGMFAAKSALADRMAAFSAPVSTSGVRFGAMLRHGVGARRQSRCLEADALWILAQSRAGQPARGSDVALAGTLAVGMRAYGDAVRAAALASVRVRVWSRWRLFHLPLFVIMTVAAGLHVAAVWGVDDGHGPAALEDGVPATSPSPPPPSVLPGLVAPGPEAPTVRGPEVSAAPDRGGRQNAVRTGRLAWLLPPSDFAGFAPTVRPSAVAEASTSAVETLAQVAPVAPVQAVPNVQDVAVMRAEPQRGPSASPQLGPLVASPAPAPAPSVRSGAEQVSPPRPVRPERPPAPRMARPVNAEAVAQAPVAVAPVASPLETRRPPEPPPMSLGAGAGLPLAQRIAQLKTERFDHSRTIFPLVGNHTRVDCAKCHTKTLEGTPTTCISCHKKDDVHRGRRPDCARCHTPKDWNVIIKKR